MEINISWVLSTLSESVPSGFAGDHAEIEITRLAAGDAAATAALKRQGLKAAKALRKAKARLRALGERLSL